MTTPTRKILHADCDCFYAAVEMRDRPELADVPLAVGGSAEKRGVIATCNYPARAYGVRSAMPTAKALRLCPDLMVLPPDFERYRVVSRQIQAIFHDLTALVEPLSLDEAYLDVSTVTRFRGSATWMAQWLKQETYQHTGITLSVGAAPSKFLAKVASDWNKPDGLCVIEPERVDAFLQELSVKRLHGVGPATAAKLEEMAIHTCGELREWPLDILIDRFGKFGYRLYELSRGIDEREVAVTRERKSVSVETTFDRDLPDFEACSQALDPLNHKLRQRLERQGNPPLDKVFIKVRFDDFSITTQETAGQEPSSTHYRSLLEQIWYRNPRPVRLLGVGVRLTPPEGQRQLSLSLGTV
ncbi:DNA polymerase IV [Aidingimonas halophila]|uniref:DNA polymerase IV n=1 Tax=Aidingimonas halophila TaxID=574349 RepID=A0A1H3B4T1_9GAMM|nr:DNA polymerase IV [Aidingimonas halophila]GHC25861.1 DNA polymerase IV [Aidingimonas halophila]SDX36631.1 DNA polymerase-4 [Aidingimonas halophila]